MVISPHALDVAPFTALNTSTSGLLDNTIQMAVLRFSAFRSFWTSEVNSNMPVYGVAMLSLIVFWIPEDELAARIELCAALFLTLIGELQSWLPLKLVHYFCHNLSICDWMPCRHSSWVLLLGNQPMTVSLPSAQPSNLW